MLRSHCALLTCVLGLASCASAQYTAGKIIFKNPGPYAQADLEAVAQLHPHDKVSNTILQAAAQRLIDTGYFDDVGAALEGSAAAINVTFVLKPYTPAQMTAVGFENFVWLTPAELTAATHKAAPLFKGMLPSAGNQPDLIDAALQQALTGKGVKATVLHEAAEPSLVQPERVIEYSISAPSVRIHQIKLAGVSTGLTPEMEKTASLLRNQHYDEGLVRPTTEDQLIDSYLNAGYADAKLDDVHREAAVTTPEAVGVDVSATINPGEPYRVDTIAFAGTPIISSDAVMKLAKLHTGDVASHRLLLETLKPIDAAYRRLGYMDVFVDSGAKRNTSLHTISYNITVTPGDQYRVRSVTANGLSVEAQAEFNMGWRMVAGELYNPMYIMGFMENNTALRSLQNYSCAYKASADPQVHLVDLTLTCFQSGSR